MPKDLSFWILLVLVIGGVVALALYLRRGLILRKDKKGFLIQVEKDEPAPASESGIQVGKGARIEGSTVGDISGLKVEGSGDVDAHGQSINVFEDGKLKDAKVGDISGVKKSQPPKS